MPLGTASLSSYSNTLTIECGVENRTLASELGRMTPPVIGDELVDTFWFLWDLSSPMNKWDYNHSSD